MIHFIPLTIKIKTNMQGTDLNSAFPPGRDYILLHTGLLHEEDASFLFHITRVLAPFKLHVSFNVLFCLLLFFSKH